MGEQRFCKATIRVRFSVSPPLSPVRGNFIIPHITARAGVRDKTARDISKLT